MKNVRMIILAALIGACPAMNGMARVAGMGSWAWNGFKNGAQSVAHTASRIPASALQWIAAHKVKAVMAAMLIAGAVAIANSDSFRRRKDQVARWTREKYWLLTDPEAANNARNGKAFRNDISRLNRIANQELELTLQNTLLTMCNDFCNKHPGITSASIDVKSNLRQDSGKFLVGIPEITTSINVRKPCGTSQSDSSENNGSAKLTSAQADNILKTELSPAATTAIDNAYKKVAARYQGLRILGNNVTKFTYKPRVVEPNDQKPVITPNATQPTTIIQQPSQPIITPGASVGQVINGELKDPIITSNVTQPTTITQQPSQPIITLGASVGQVINSELKNVEDANLRASFIARASQNQSQSDFDNMIHQELLPAIKTGSLNGNQELYNDIAAARMGGARDGVDYNNIRQWIPNLVAQ